MGSTPRTGFRRGLTDLYDYLDSEIPLGMPRGGKVFYVGNLTGGGGSDSAGHGTFDLPYATVAYALTQCTASRGDLILVKSGHAETLSAAAAIACATAGVTILGLGRGGERPTFTWSTSTAATWTVTAANVSILNIIGICNINALVTAFSITGARCTLDIEWQDSATNKEAVTAILGGTGADKMRIRLRYMGQTGGSSCVAPIQLNGTDEASIDVDFYGKASTAVVNFITTACTGIRITGNMYNSGTTNGTKLCVDTITGSTWWLDVFDGAAGGKMSGGSGAAIASDDASVIAANLLVPSADVATNTAARDVIGNKSDASVLTVGTTGSLAAYAKGTLTYQLVPAADASANVAAKDVIGNKSDAGVTVVGTTASLEAYTKGLVTMNTVQSADSTNNAFAGDAVGNKSDATVQAVATTKSLMGYMKGVVNALASSAGYATFPSSAVPANGVNLGQVVREIFDISEKSIGTVTAATMPQATTTIFTVAGGAIEILNLISYCVTTNNGNAATLQWQFDGTLGTATTITGASASLASLVAGDLVICDFTLLTTAPLIMSTGISAVLGSPTTQRFVVTNGSGGVIQAIVGTAATTGTWNHYLRYRPLARGVTVTAAF